MFQKIAGQLLPEHLIVGHIVIERTYQVITILPRPLNGIIKFMSPCLCIAYHVHPVPRPALTKSRRIEEMVDHALIGIFAFIICILVDHLRSRRQAGEEK